MGAGEIFARVMRSGILGAALLGAAALPAYAESDLTLSGSAVLATQYVDRGLTNSAEKPAVQPEFDLTYKEIFYAGIWGSNVNFGSGPNGQDLADLEIDYYVGITRRWASGTSILPPITSPIRAPSIPVASSTTSRSGRGVSRSLLNDKLDTQTRQLLVA